LKPTWVARGLLSALYGVGTILPRKRVPVLIYHSVDDSASPVSIHPHAFREHLEVLRDAGCRTTTVSEVVDGLRRDGSAPDGLVALTFDDGFESVYAEALPILEEFGFTCSVFLATEYVGKTCTWEKERGVPDLPLMSWKMAKEMGRLGIDFQSHSATHPHLRSLPAERIRKELRRSREAIEDELGTRCDILCYPYGEFDQRVAALLPAEGYVAGFGCTYWGRPGIFSLKRIGSGHLTTPLALKVALKGYFDIYYNAKMVARRVFG